MFGYGYPIEGLKRAIREDIAFIGVDAGSTDSGPYYLGSGKGFVKEMQIRRDLEPALVAARDKNIPLIIGSAGGSGARPHVDFFCDILFDLAKKNKLSFKLAVIYADLDKDFILQNFEDGKISPCGPAPELTPEKITKCTNPVGQMGTEPLIAALEAGVDVIVAGRCCDTAIFAAMPIMKGFDLGLSLHCAKIAECGALCARRVVRMIRFWLQSAKIISSLSRSIRAKNAVRHLLPGILFTNNLTRIVFMSLRAK